jgi:dTDP-glucose 4,6-dehydratase
MKIPVYGNGLNVRDWLFVKDHCSAIDLVMRKSKPGEIYNVGGNNELKNIEVVKKLLRIMNKSDNLIEYVKDRPGHDLRYAIDSSKLQRDFNWMPTISFDEGLMNTVEWYLTNKDWWKKILSGEYKDYYDEHYKEE